MGIATVTLAGLSDLHQIQAFLELGAVVVIAPGDDVLTAWIRERLGEPDGHTCRREAAHLQIKRKAHRVEIHGQRMPLTELEYRTLVLLSSEMERARSFQELRTAAWKDAGDFAGDVFSVRSVIQRLRRKLREAGAPVRIESVRGFGFQLIPADDAPASHLHLAQAGEP
jgi:DNA-binding response OmpR family regulator